MWSGFFYGSVGSKQGQGPCWVKAMDGVLVRTDPVSVLDIACV